MCCLHLHIILSKGQEARKLIMSKMFAPRWKMRHCVFIKHQIAQTTLSNIMLIGKDFRRDLCINKNITRGAYSRFPPNQREKALLCNDDSHWLGVIQESALTHGICFFWIVLENRTSDVTKFTSA